MISFGTKGQGESLIKLLVVAIIALIAIALAKSYFREASKKTEQTIQEAFEPTTTISPIVEVTIQPELVINPLPK